MIKDIISFSLADHNFSVDLMITPVILTAANYIPTNSNAGLPESIQFNDVNVEIIDIYSKLNLKFKRVTDKSKILVGEVEGKMIGIFVDSVKEIISIKNDLQKLPPKKDQYNESFLSEFNYLNEIHQLIDIHKLVREKYLRKNLQT
jgi:chemotaxis signal transduction protein